MTAQGPERAGPNLIGRVREMLLRPESAWNRIDAEPSTPNDLYRFYVIPMAAIPAACALIGVLVFRGYQIASIGVRPSLLTSAIEAVMSYALTLVMVFVLAVVIETVAPWFGGVKSRAQAFKLVAYSGTAFWVSGLLALYPSLSWPAGVLGGLYSLYTLNLGLPKLMRVSHQRSLVCFAVILFAVVLMVLLKGALTAIAAELGGPLAAS
jgi:hypothetical protein